MNLSNINHFNSKSEIFKKSQIRCINVVMFIIFGTFVQMSIANAMSSDGNDTTEVQRRSNFITSPQQTASAQVRYWDDQVEKGQEENVDSITYPKPTESAHVRYWDDAVEGSSTNGL